MDYSKILSDRQFRSSAGMCRLDFDQLLADYEAHYFSQYGKSYQTYIEEDVFDSGKVVLKTLGDCLFLVLFQQKNDLVFDSLGAVFSMSGSVAHRYFERYSAILEALLSKKSNAGP
jgi:hypothetical protein